MARRIAVALLLLVSACYAFYRFTVLPLVCNRQKATVLARTQRAVALGGGHRTTVLARDNVAGLAFCRRTCNDVDLAMLTAANYRLLGRWNDAVTQYQQALEIQQRPEVYVSLAETLLALELREEATRAYERAAVFAPNYITTIEDPEMRHAVQRAVEERDARIRAAAR